MSRQPLTFSGLYYPTIIGTQALGHALESEVQGLWFRGLVIVEARCISAALITRHAPEP